MKIIEFVVEGEPVAQQRHKHRTVPIKKDVAIFNVMKMVQSSTNAKSTAEDVYEWFKQATNQPMTYDPCKDLKDIFKYQTNKFKPKEPIDVAIGVDMNFYLKRPGNHFGSKDGVPYLKEQFKSKWCIKNKDKDNLEKFVLDCMNNRFFTDDKLVCTGTTTKYWCDPGDEPRTEVVIWPL